MSTKESSFWTALDRAGSIAVILALCVVVWRWVPFGANSATPKVEFKERVISIESAEVIGASSAPIVMLVFSDFSCPFCAKYANETMPRLQQEYVAAGTLTVAFRHFPLSIHPTATAASAAAICAGRAGKFWKVHDAFFREPAEWTDSIIARRLAHLLSADEVSSAQSCIASGDVIDQIRADIAEAKGLGVTGTPEFFVGRRTSPSEFKAVSRISGAQPYEKFVEVIDLLGAR